jgi:hypothetical protein
MISLWLLKQTSYEINLNKYLFVRVDKMHQQDLYLNPVFFVDIVFRVKLTGSSAWVLRLF